MSMFLLFADNFHRIHPRAFSRPSLVVLRIFRSSPPNPQQCDFTVLIIRYILSLAPLPPYRAAPPLGHSYTVAVCERNFLG